jgi:Protein of unknown function (DUF664)
VADLKPPRVIADEAGTLRALLQYQRESLVRKVAGLDEASARNSPVGSGTSPLWLMRHLADAEITWVVRRFAGEQPGPAEDGSTRDDTLAGAVGFYRQTWRSVDAIAFSGRFGLDEVCRRPDAEPAPSLRWVLMHLLQETARHAGHADILRELIDGGTGR